MAVYKVLQDIEAEDKLIGPLTAKQALFIAVAFVIGAMGYFAARVNILLIIPFLPFFVFFGFMGSPIGRDQPNDVWLAARIRFLIKPRKRIWNQDGLEELVTITAPKRMEISRTDGLRPHEVNSRLKALAATLDSRGWAVKNVSVNLYSQPGYFASHDDSDRLINLNNIPQDVSPADVSAADDILDASSNSVAARFDNAIRQRQQEHIEYLKTATASGQIANPMAAPRPPERMLAPAAPQAAPGYATFGSQVVSPGGITISQDGEMSDEATAQEQEFLEKRHSEMEIEKGRLSSHKVIDPAGPKPAPPVVPAVAPATQSKPAPVKQNTAEHAKLKELSESNYTVATIAGLAKHAEESSLKDDDVISFH